jgi:hypothetical protein
MIKDVLEVEEDGGLVLSCEFQSESTTVFYSLNINGVVEYNKELFFYE